TDSLDRTLTLRQSPPGLRCRPGGRDNSLGDRLGGLGLSDGIRHAVSLLPNLLDLECHRLLRRGVVVWSGIHLRLLAYLAALPVVRCHPLHGALDLVVRPLAA